MTTPTQLSPEYKHVLAAVRSALYDRDPFVRAEIRPSRVGPRRSDEIGGEIGEEPAWDPATGENLSAPLLELSEEELVRAISGGGPVAWVVDANLAGSTTALSCARRWGAIEVDLAGLAAAALTGGSGINPFFQEEDLPKVWEPFAAVIPLEDILSTS